MISRTTLTMAGRQSIENLETIRRRRERALSQISTGLEISRPSDGPARAAGVVRTDSDIRVLNQFKLNLQGVNEQLAGADAVLHQGVNVLMRAHMLATQGANFTQTDATRDSIALEVESLMRNMVDIANANQGGKFFFAGLREETQPFVIDLTQPDGVLYLGDQGRRSVNFPGGTSTQVSLDGRGIFLNPDEFLGAGRAAGTVGTATPNPPAGIGISFSNGLTGSIFADLPGFFVASAAPTVPAAGDQVTVSFTSTDATITGSIVATMAGGESTAAIAAALNAQVALNPSLAGRISFSDSAGRLKIVESDTVGQGFSFTSTATGGFVTGLESGGVIGGMSAQEIAAALTAQVSLDPSLASAGVRFTAVGGQVQVDGDVNFTFSAVDFPRGTGFASGLAGQHDVGGVTSSNIFRALNQLRLALLANDQAAVSQSVAALGRAVQHLSNEQGFYGAAQRQTLVALEEIDRFGLLNDEKMSTLRDADLVRAITDLNQAQVNEQATLQVGARLPGPSLFDYLA